MNAYQTTQWLSWLLCRLTLLLLYLVMLLLGGMVIPFTKLPGALRTIAHGLPSGALADVLREALGGNGSQPTTSWIVLAIWAVIAPLIAATLFRWDV